MTTDMGVLSLGTCRRLNAESISEIGEGCLNGDVKKSSGKIQYMKRDSVCVLLSTRSYLKLTYKELGYTTKVELVMLLARLALFCSLAYNISLGLAVV